MGGRGLVDKLDCEGRSTAGGTRGRACFGLRGRIGQRVGSALREAAWGPGGMRDREQIQVDLGGQEVEGGPSARALFALKEELRAVGVEGRADKKNWAKALGRDGRGTIPGQAEVWGLGQVGW